MKRILFLKFGALGDVLMATPLLRQTRRTFPGAEIDFCVASSFAPALRGNPNLNDIVTFESAVFTKHQIGGLFRLIGKLRAGRYDLVFVLDKHPVFALIALLAGISERIGFTRDRAARIFLTRHVPFGGLRHDVHANLDLLNTVAQVDYSDVGMDFYRPSEDKGRGTSKFPQLGGEYFACTNSGGENEREKGGIRRLPSKIFLQLIADLSARQPTVLLGGRNDETYYASLPLPEGVINLAGKTSFAECAEIIAHAKKFFTTDCGLMHLAATTETPICAFFGPTHPLRKAPLRKDVETHWADAAIYDPEYDRSGRIGSNADQHFQALSVVNCAR